MNLACKAVLTLITKMEYASEQATDYVPGGVPAVSVMEAIDRDPIATMRSLIRTVRRSVISRPHQRANIFHRYARHHFGVQHLATLSRH